MVKVRGFNLEATKLRQRFRGRADAVDGPPVMILRCMKPYENGEIVHVNWCRISFINSMHFAH